jgi:DNA-binding PadR family transcriptional regulator
MRYFATEGYLMGMSGFGVCISRIIPLYPITFTDILYYSKRNKKGVCFIRDYAKGGFLTETTFLVLLAVYQPNHGYGILKFVEKETNGRVILGAGTLYGAIKALLRKKWIEPINIEDGSNKKQYIITESGRQASEKELARVADLLRLASSIMKKDVHSHT